MLQIKGRVNVSHGVVKPSDPFSSVANQFKRPIEDIMTDKYCGECKHQVFNKLCKHPEIENKTSKADHRLHLLANGQLRTLDTCLNMRKPKGLCGTAGTLHCK